MNYFDILYNRLCKLSFLNPSLKKLTALALSMDLFIPEIHLNEKQKRKLKELAENEMETFIL